MGIVFYYTPMTSATRVHWALEELGVPYDKVKIDLSKGEQRQPDFLKLNPNGKVPCMVIDGQPVFESLAMLLYLGEAYGVDKGLFPPPGPQRLEAFKWMSWGSVSLVEAGSRLMRNTSERFPAEHRSAAQAAAAHAEIAELLRVLDSGIGARPFLVGDQFTLVDVTVGAAVLFLAQRLNVELTKYPNVAAWAGRLTSRPALGRALSG
jgi:glutathione S-transferase